MSEPFRKYAVASVEVYPEGRGDPVVIDRGLGIYDPILKVAPTGLFSRGEPNTVEYLFSTLLATPEVGLICRPFWTQQDTKLSQYNVSGNNWSSRKAATGYRKEFLVQHSASRTLQYWTTSKYSLPENPNFAFTIALGETPTGWNFKTLPPYVRIEFGNGKFGIQSQEGGLYLVAWLNGRWNIVGDIQQNETSIGENIVWVQCVRGKIGISTDLGKSYVWYGNEDTISPITVNSGPITIRGQGHTLAFRLDQLRMLPGEFRTQHRNDYKKRLISPVSTITGKDSTPYGTSIEYLNTSVSENGLIGYGIRLIPKAIPSGFGWDFYATPSVQGVSYTYPVTTLSILENPTTPWDKKLFEVSIDKPRDLSGATCTLKFYKDIAEAFSGNYDRRKINVKLGYKLSDGTTEWVHQSIWYIRSINVDATDKFGVHHVEVIADNVSCRLKETSWDVFHQYNLGGATLNQSNDFILYTEGMNSSYRNWHALGNIYQIEEGLAEEPFELTKPQEIKWETLTRINKNFGMEVAASDDGKLVSVPMNVNGDVWTTGIVHELKYRPDSGDSVDISKLIKSLNNPFDCGENVSCVLVFGTGLDGRTVLAFAVDEIAEDPVYGPLFGKFVPWRRSYQEEINDKCSSGTVNMRCVGLAYEKFPQKREPTIELPPNLTIGRRDEVSIKYAEGLGIPNGTRFVAMSQSIRFNAREALASITMSVGLRKKNAQS